MEISSSSVNDHEGWLERSQALPERWELEELDPFNPRYVLALLENDLFFWFTARESSASSPLHPVGSFVEGLWERDVAELFIPNPQSSQYRELNVAPGGAWWFQEFHDYRKRAEPPPSLKGITSGGDAYLQHEERCWYAWLKLPLTMLYSGPDRSRVNVCSILGTERRRYYSLEPIAADKPDFHLSRGIFLKDALLQV